MFLFVVLPIFLIAVFVGVESWLWKGILVAVVGGTWYFSAPVCIAVAVVLIIGIATKNSLSRISGSKI